jgi:hypothetical protein
MLLLLSEHRSCFVGGEKELSNHAADPQLEQDMIRSCIETRTCEEAVFVFTFDLVREHNSIVDVGSLLSTEIFCTRRCCNCCVFCKSQNQRM